MSIAQLFSLTVLVSSFLTAHQHITA